MDKDVPILVCGVGSIGERHITNLLMLGYNNIAIHRTRNRPYATSTSELPVYLDLTEALNTFKPQIAFITNPTSMHIDSALVCARFGCHLFIEKPLGSSFDHVDELQSILQANNRYAMVAYMLRFHPLFRQVKQWLNEGDEGTLGRPIWARSSWGEHVPDWHPWEDYRESYSVRTELGGGPSLTLSHDIDLLLWYLGEAIGVAVLPNSATPLEVECDHGVDILVSFANRSTANIHLDYYQSPPSRTWELVGTRGRVTIDYLAGLLTRYSNVIGAPTVSGNGSDIADIISLGNDWQRNELFLAEVQYFFECIQSSVQPEPGLRQARAVMETALGALPNPTIRDVKNSVEHSG